MGSDSARSLVGGLLLILLYPVSAAVMIYLLTTIEAARLPLIRTFDSPTYPIGSWSLALIVVAACAAVLIRAIALFSLHRRNSVSAHRDRLLEWVIAGLAVAILALCSDFFAVRIVGLPLGDFWRNAAFYVILIGLGSTLFAKKIFAASGA
jgi:hypothetical protein